MRYVINAARAAKADGPQRLVYVSVGGADPASRFLYTRSKGLTELGLAGLGYSDTIVFRPMLLAGTNRNETRIAESIAGFFSGLASRFTSNLEIQVPTLAKSIVLAGRLGSSALPAAANATKAGKEGEQFTVVGNAGAISLAKDA